uniref:Winged helix-turn-helix domain-containing protein n=1 Tax=uncultured Chloroflexota bacterium TaxID=166587 RepID=H5SHP1_9CHLR|nr:hypothetical protein HGMM_F30B08C29 [uncultured Chloroflexota bacterium]
MILLCFFPHTVIRYMPSPKNLLLSRWQEHRKRTFRLLPEWRLTSIEQARHYVNERGFIFFWPVKGVDLPSLWVATAGDRPVPNEHDDPGHITWDWKDQALGKRWWYYAKVLRRKATLISLEILPYFYALSENYGDMAHDHLEAYEAGRLTIAARNIYEALLREGALDSLSLRRASGLSRARDSEWQRALEDLQADFKILPVGIAQAGAWHYAFIYDLTLRHYPQLAALARPIGEAEARRRLLKVYLESVGAVPPTMAQKLFGWSPPIFQRTVRSLIEQGEICYALHPQRAEEWLALPSLGED